MPNPKSKTQPKWPSQVPVFSAEDIHQKSEYQVGKQCCAVGWLLKLFLKIPEYGAYDFSIFYQAVKEFKKHAKGLRNYSCIEEWNDDPKRTTEEIAQTLNKTMVGLGYSHYE